MQMLYRWQSVKIVTFMMCCQSFLSCPKIQVYEALSYQFLVLMILINSLFQQHRLSLQLSLAQGIGKLFPAHSLNTTSHIFPTILFSTCQLLQLQPIYYIVGVKSQFVCCVAMVSIAVTHNYGSVPKAYCSRTKKCKLFLACQTTKSQIVRKILHCVVLTNGTKLQKFSTLKGKLEETESFP